MTLHRQDRRLLDPIFLRDPSSQVKRGRKRAHIGRAKGSNLRKVAHTVGDQGCFQILVDAADPR